VYTLRPTISDLYTAWCRAQDRSIPSGGGGGGDNDDDDDDDDDDDGDVCLVVLPYIVLISCAHYWISLAKYINECGR